jgi:hypothetical protein
MNLRMARLGGERLGGVVAALFDDHHVDPRVGELRGHRRAAGPRADDDHVAVDPEVRCHVRAVRDAGDGSRPGRKRRAVARQPALCDARHIAVRSVRELLLDLRKLVIAEDDQALDTLQDSADPAPGEYVAKVCLRLGGGQAREPPTARPGVQPGTLVEGHQRAGERHAGPGRQRGQQGLELRQQRLGNSVGRYRWRARYLGQPRHDRPEAWAELTCHDAIPVLSRACAVDSGLTSSRL